MRDFVLKSEESSPVLTFSLYDYGKNKSHDWRISLDTQMSVSIGGNTGGEFNSTFPVKSCLYSLTLKDLERLQKWTTSAIEEFKKIDQKKGME